MQGTVPGGSRRGRPKKCWHDNIKEWTELPLTKTLRLAEDKDGWRKIIKTSVVPLQPPNGKGLLLLMMMTLFDLHRRNRWLTRVPISVIFDYSNIISNSAVCGRAVHKWSTDNYGQVWENCFTKTLKGGHSCLSPPCGSKHLPLHQHGIPGRAISELLLIMTSEVMKTPTN